MTGEPSLVPELAVTDCGVSLRFWRDLLGFEVRFTVPFCWRNALTSANRGATARGKVGCLVYQGWAGVCSVDAGE